MLCGGLIILKKIFIFLALAFCLSVPAFADDSRSLDGWDSSDFLTDYVSDASLLPEFIRNPKTNLGSVSAWKVVWVLDGKYYMIGDNDFDFLPYVSPVVYSNGYTGLSIFKSLEAGNSSPFFYYYSDKEGRWCYFSGTYDFPLVDYRGVKGSLLYTDVDMHFIDLDGIDCGLFFSVPVPPRPLEEIVEEMQGTQVKESLIPYLEDSLGSLVPFGIGLLALLVGSVILPKVLCKFL